MKPARRRLSILIALLLSFALVAAACGGDDDETEGTTDTEETTEEEAAPEETTEEEAAPEETEEAAPEETEEEAAPEETEAPAELVDVNIAVSPAITVLPHFTAFAEGIFEKYGINPIQVGVAAGPELGAAMISGDINVAGNIPNNQIGLITAGFDVVAFHEIFSANFFDILVSSSYDLGGATEWQDVMAALEGANVGVVANGAAAEDIARSLFIEAGIDPDAQTYIATGLPDTTLAAMSNGEIDMAITFDPAFVLAEAQGIGTQPFSIAAGEGPASLIWPGLLATASREWVESNPELAANYRAALAEATQFMLDPANRDRINEIMVDEMGLPAELAGPLFDNNAEYFNPTGDFSTDALSAAAQWVFDIGKSGDAVLPVEEWTVEVG